MTMWENIRSSVIKFCNDFAAEMRDDGTTDLKIFDFDSHVENQALPESDLIGPWQLSLEAEGRLATVRGMIGISVLNDPNLFRLNQLSGVLFERLIPDSVISLVDAETGEEVGHLKAADGTSMSPVASAQQRSLKFLAFTLKSDLAFS